jgi:hypothetical protein
MIAETIPALNALTSDQKIILAAELWRAAVGDSAEAPDPKIVKALEERLKFYEANPDQVSTWEEVRGRIIANKGRNA